MSDKCPFCGKGKDEYPKCAFCKDKETSQADITSKTDTKATSDLEIKQKTPDQKLKQKISDLEIKQKSPEIYTLVQKADIALKQKNLAGHSARVALCLDISASMGSLYRSGKVQALAERTLALGCRFDDNGSIDIFLFGSSAYNAGDMTMDNFKGFIDNINKKYQLESGTRYGLAIEMIRRFYFPDAKGQKREKPINAALPVYVMFITDGETHDKPYTESQIKWAAYEPVFWQFMGVGESKKDVKAGGIKGFLSRMIKPDFEFLEQLDEMSGRFVDNANFFSVKDPADIGDDELYSLMMGEYPDWLKLAHSKGLL
ncbi:MAG: VWA domain-containing protein [Desulfobacterales bacterium]|nr:VWA domain-containing protein [Desulfobacterales bacterium]